MDLIKHNFYSITKDIPKQNGLFFLQVCGGKKI